MREFKDTLAPWIGLGAVAGFTVFIFFLLKHLDYGEPEWSRTIYLFGGVEAVAFTAFGYFFGKEVHRERAEKAEKKVDEATKEASSAKETKVAAEEKLSALNLMINAKRDRRLADPSRLILLDSLTPETEDASVLDVNLSPKHKVGLGHHLRASDSDWDELATISTEFTRA